MHQSKQYGPRATITKCDLRSDKLCLYLSQSLGHCLIYFADEQIDITGCRF